MTRKVTNRKPLGDPAKLARIWADAVPLYDFLNARANEIISRSPSAPASCEPISKLSGAELALRSVQITSKSITANRKAPIELQNELIAARLQALGRAPDAYEFEQIDPSFWIGASIDWSECSARRDKASFIEIRIVAQQSIDAKRQDDMRVFRTTAEVVEAAIEHYAKSDPNLQDARGTRFRAYRKFAERLGYKPYRDRGFSDKTFEAKETEFRNRNR